MRFQLAQKPWMARRRWPQRGLIGAAVWAVLTLTGCDQLGIETPQKTAERQLSDAKAIGGACRHAMRAIEDCYLLNPKAEKSSVFAGWREMDEYMRENKLEGIAPVVPRPAPAASAASKPSEPDDGDEDEPAPKSAKAGGKAGKSSDH
jgi:hypothetical protein